MSHADKPPETLCRLADLVPMCTHGANMEVAQRSRRSGDVLVGSELARQRYASRCLRLPKKRKLWVTAALDRRASSVIAICKHCSLADNFAALMSMPSWTCNSREASDVCARGAALL